MGDHHQLHSLLIRNLTYYQLNTISLMYLCYFVFLGYWINSEIYIIVMINKKQVEDLSQISPPFASLYQKYSWGEIGLTILSFALQAILMVPVRLYGIFK